MRHRCQFLFQVQLVCFSRPNQTKPPWIQVSLASAASTRRPCLVAVPGCSAARVFVHAGRPDLWLGPEIPSVRSSWPPSRTGLERLCGAIKVQLVIYPWEVFLNKLHFHIGCVRFHLPHIRSHSLPGCGFVLWWPILRADTMNTLYSPHRLVSCCLQQTSSLSIFIGKLFNRLLLLFSINQLSETNLNRRRVWQKCGAEPD